MAFTIVHPESHQTSWVPILADQVCYIGQIVHVDSATPLEGVFALDTAGAESNLTNYDIPMGVIIGFNATAGNMVHNTTYHCQQMTAPSVTGTHDSTTQFRGVEGPWSRGDKMAMAHIHHIDPTTVIRGDIFDTTYGTAVSEVLVTTGCGGDGIGCTTAAGTATLVAQFGTIYMRSGANMGIYRTLTNTSTTAQTWLQAMPHDVAVGDSALIVGLRTHGTCRMDIDAAAMFVDANHDHTTNWFNINVRRLDLSTPGKEYVEFTFDAANFEAHRGND